MNKDLLDKIKLKDGRCLSGIVDYVSTKQIYFFDFTNDVNIDFLTLAILWKGYNSEMRFSVYCAIEHPNLVLPRSILVPILNIKYCTKEIVKTKLPKQRKKMIRT